MTFMARTIFSDVSLRKLYPPRIDYQKITNEANAKLSTCTMRHYVLVGVSYRQTCLTDNWYSTTAQFPFVLLWNKLTCTKRSFLLNDNVLPFPLVVS